MAGLQYNKFSKDKDKVILVLVIRVMLLVLRGNNASGQTRVVKSYNCQGKGYMAKQCTQPKRQRNAAWYKDKAMLAEAQEAEHISDEEQLAFHADLGIPDAVLMANISNDGTKVILENGNNKKSLGRDLKGGIIILPLVSFKEHVAVQKETKVRTLLLQSLPEDHMADFHHLDDAREIWLAVKARLGGNEESKKMRKTMLKQEFCEFRVSEEEGWHKGYDRFQKILSQLNQMQAKPDNDDVNLKFLRALPPSWSQVSLTLKTRRGLEYLSYGSRGEPSSLFDFKEVMNNNHNQEPPPAGPPPQNNNGPPLMVKSNGQASRSID
uniref:Xylulose kinase-1 n=1 Tax=Tanacetum cinerariifolium TaxID=118510 RepID=A0A6L2KAW1_TANCI|nr:xylulose kinase-1 [Tanacetum cinerariifolium]